MTKPLKSLIYCIILALFFGPSLRQSAFAQSPTPAAAPKNPYERTIELEESGRYDTNRPTLTPEQQTTDGLKSLINSIGGEVQKMEMAYGTITSDGGFAPGALNALKLKPSDKKRLIKIANGSLTEKEKASIVYDKRLMDLLIKLTSPKELGGGGIDHLRIGDVLRFRTDPKSKETEGTDNISQHQFGKAADIIEVGKTNCTEEGLFGDKDLPPFPVKVIWQGGAPYNPSPSVLGSFDAIARANAFRDVLGSLPGDSYEGANQGLTELLQQLQRRVISQELGLDRSSLDFLTEDDFLATLGQAMVNKDLGYPTGALRGTNAEEMARSIPQAYFESALKLPPGSFSGDTVQDALKNLGIYKAAFDSNASVKDLQAGKTDGLKNSPYFNFYAEAEKAFGLPSGTLEGIKNNKAESFAAIGARLIAERLHYSEKETNDLITQAKQGQVKQLSLARIGDIAGLPLPILPMIAPAADSSKKDGEIALANHVLGSASSKTLAGLSEDLSSVLKDLLSGLTNTSSKQDITNALFTDAKTQAAYRLIGAKAMEKVFDLPTDSFSAAVKKHGAPTLEQFVPLLGAQVIKEDQLTNKNSTSVGQSYYATQFREAFTDLYHISTVGLAKFTDADMYAVLTGQITDATTRAGASWVEEDLGLAPDSFAAFFANASEETRLVSAGVSVLGGEIFDAFDIITDSISTGAELTARVGQARIETVLGLAPGSFQDSITTVKERNADRFALIFKKPESIDTITGLPQGSTAKVLDGSLALKDASTLVGQRLIERLSTDNLQDKLGWDGRFTINGNELLAGIKGETYKQPDSGATSQGAVPELRPLLAKIGAYNSDYAFGYDPGTTDKWIRASGAAQDQILLEQGSRRYSERLGLDLSDSGDLLAAFQKGPDTTATSSGEGSGITKAKKQSVSDVISQAFEKRIKLPDGERQIPRTDILSLVRGEMPTVTYAVMASNQAKQVKVNFERKYDLFRILVSGSSTDSEFETKLSKEGLERYGRVLQDIVEVKAEDYKDRLLERVTNGVIKSGVLDLLSTPYDTPILDIVKANYFTGKEARGDYFYGLLDSEMGKKDTALPPNFSETLMEGSNADRSLMIMDYLNGHMTEGLLSSLPQELRPLATSWLNNKDITAGSVLAENPAFTGWASSVFNELTKTSLPEPAVKLAMSYVSGTFDPKIIAEDPASALGLSRDNMTVWIGSNLGLPTGQFTEYYQKYKQAQQLYTSYQNGTLDPAQAVFVIDSLFLDGKLSELTQSIDDALGLPGGSTQMLIQFAITQNPIYLAQFIFNLFFSTTITCPDLQVEAQNNVKKLIKEIINQGENTAKPIPSQIITYSQSYLRDLSKDIKKNYAVCQQTSGALCGVFARPEYAKQVHIGF